MQTFLSSCPGRLALLACEKMFSVQHLFSIFVLKYIPRINSPEEYRQKASARGGGGGVITVAQFTLLLMNRLNKTNSAVFHYNTVRSLYFRRILFSR